MATKSDQKRKPAKLVFGLSKEKEYLMDNLAMLLDSGMGVMSALKSIRSELKSRYMKKLVIQMEQDIEAGMTIWQALKYTGIFPEHIIALIRVGEESGQLPQNLKVVVEQQQKESIFKSKLRSAMMYPVFVLGLTVVIGVGIAWFILPNLSTIFDQMNIPLPTITKVLIAFGVFLRDYGYFAVPGLIFGMIFFVYIFFIYKKTKFIGQAFLRRVPGVKKMLLEVEMSRFGHLLGNLLQTGLPITESLDSLLTVSTQTAYQKLYAHLRDGIEEGKSFQQSFASFKGLNRLIPSPIQQMIVAGEQTGRLPAALNKIGNIFEARIDTTSKDLMVILEPVLLVVIWVGVVSVALAVILPIYSLIGGF